MTSLVNSGGSIVSYSTSCGNKRRQLENKSELDNNKNSMVALPGDVIDSIIYKLDPVDFNSFVLVCRSWQSIAIAAKKRLQLQLQVPWLMFSFSSSGAHPRPKFFSLSHGKMSRPMLPLSHGKMPRLKLLEARGIRCCGSSWGWLIMACRLSNRFLLNPLHPCRRSNLFLLNPFTGVQIQLPRYKIPFLPQVGTRIDCIRKALLLSPPSTVATATTSRRSRSKWDDPLPRNKRWDNHNNTVVVHKKGAHDCVAVVIDHNCYLSFCRVGDDMWVNLKGRYEDIILFHGQVYVIGFCFELLRLELGPCPEFISCNIAHPEGEVGGSFAADQKAVYLVESLGDLLMVIRRWEFVCSDPDLDGFCKCQSSDRHLPRTNVLKIFKLDFKGLCWTPVENLGNQMLFVGSSGGISLSALDFPSFRGNSIYFTQQNFHPTTPAEIVPTACNDTGVFHLEYKSFKPLFLADGVSPCSPPVWFQPISLLKRH